VAGAVTAEYRRTLAYKPWLRQIQPLVPVAAAAFPGDHLLLLRAGTALPELWYARLIQALDLPAVLVVYHWTISIQLTRRCRRKHTATPIHVRSSTVLRWGERAALDWPSFSPLLSLWNGTALQGLDLGKIHKYTLPAQFAPWP